MSNPQPDNKKEWSEEFELKGNELVDRVKELIQQGNVRRLIIRKSDGDVLMEIPLTTSVVAGSALLVFNPVLAALGAAAAFITQVKLEVVRVGDEKPKHSDDKERIDIE